MAMNGVKTGQNGNLEQRIGVGTTTVDYGTPYWIEGGVSGIKIIPIKTENGYLSTSKIKIAGLNGDIDPSTFQSRGIIPVEKGHSVIVKPHKDPNDGGHFYAIVNNIHYQI